MYGEGDSFSWQSARTCRRRGLPRRHGL